jgi:hypothetical protein
VCVSVAGRARNRRVPAQCLASDVPKSMLAKILGCYKVQTHNHVLVWAILCSDIRYVLTRARARRTRASAVRSTWW